MSATGGDDLGATGVGPPRGGAAAPRIGRLERWFVRPFRRNPWGAVLAVGLVVVALLLRLMLFGFEGNDLRYFMFPWYDYIASHGGFAAMKDPFSDYTPPYLYLLAIAAALPLKRIFAIKIVSVAFDVLLAALAAAAVREKRRGGPLPALAFFAVLFAPTVLVNSSLWGQNDAIYTSCLVLTVFLLMRDRSAAAMVAFGVALAFKAQAVFLCPLLFVLFVKRKILFRHLLLVPGAYAVLMIPAALAGRPIVDLLLIYPRQAGEYPHLTMGAPNLYQWLPDNWGLLRNPGILLTVAVVLVLGFVAARSATPIDADGIVRLALLSCVAVPFMLPGMHERYFFPADVLAVVFAFYFPRFFAIPLVVGLVSFFAYLPFLTGRTVVGLGYLAIVMLAVLALLARDWLRTLDLGPGGTSTRGG